MNRTNFRIEIGTDRTLSMKARTSAGAVLNLTGATIFWQVAKTFGGSAEISKTGTIVSAAAGTFSVSWTDGDSLDDGAYEHWATVSISGTDYITPRGTIQITGGSGGGLLSTSGVNYNGSQLYGTIAEAQASSVSASVDYLIVPGRANLADNDGGVFRRVGAASTGARSFTSRDGAIWEKTARFENLAYVEDYGAVGDGTTDDADAFQAAIDALPYGGVIKLQRKKYRIETALVANAGVLLDGGQTWSEVSTNTNGSADGRPMIFWGGSAGQTMFKVSPATVGSVVFGGGSIGIEWHGGSTAACAVHLDNTKYGKFDGKISRVTGDGLILSSDSGSVSNFSEKNHINSLEFIWGTADACKPANGLTLRGNGSTVPSTQQFVWDVFGLVYDGSLVEVGETDSAQFFSVHGVVQSGGAGRALDLLAGGSQDSNDNVFLYVTGKIRQGPSVIGNRFLHVVTEAGGISQSSGSSQWGGTLVDYVTGEQFIPRQYKLRDKLSIPSGALTGGGSTTTGDFASQWTAVILAESATRDCSVVVPTPYHWNAGVIESVDVFVGSNGTSAGNYRVRMRAMTKSSLGNGSTPEEDITQTSAADAQYVIKTINFPFTPLAFVKENHLLLRFTRIGADGADTNTDDMYVLGMRVNYKSSGPPTGAYTWEIPEWT